jgi:cytochrome b
LFNQHNHHDKPLYAGHNPLGQYAFYIMWTLILLLGFTGWLSRTDQFWGEDWPVDLHQMLSNVLQGMVVLHLMAVMLLSKRLGRNLVRAMIRGK